MVDRLRVLVAVTSVVLLFGLVSGNQPRICSSSAWGPGVKIIATLSKRVGDRSKVLKYAEDAAAHPLVGKPLVVLTIPTGRDGVVLFLSRHHPATSGDVSGIPSTVPYHAVVGPGVVKWKVYLPEVCLFGAVGTMVVACDTDKAPVITFYNQSTVYIKRLGNVWIPGSINVKVFCHNTKPEAIEPSLPTSDMSNEFDETGDGVEEENESERSLPANLRTKEKWRVLYM